MDFHEEIYAIHNNWVNGRIDKAQAVLLFEGVMKRNLLLPQDVGLDPGMPDDDLLRLLNQAFAIRAEALAWHIKQAQAIVPQPKGVFICPVCKRGNPSLFNTVNVSEQDDGDQVYPAETHKLDPPRCETCAREWMDVNVFRVRAAKVTVFDSTRATPLTVDEKLFFMPYERQMKEPGV